MTKTIMKVIREVVTWGVTETSNVYLIFFVRLFWATGFRAEQMNDAKLESTYLTIHLLDLSDIVNILLLIEILVSLTSSNT
jgi:hypothetical protein